MFLPFSSLCPNSRHMTPQAPRLGHRKPLHGSAPTCFCTFCNSVSSVTAYLTHQALSGRDGAHLSQVQSNCFVLFSDLSRSEAQSESYVEPANPACFLIYLHAAKHKDQGVFWPKSIRSASTEARWTRLYSKLWDVAGLTITPWDASKTLFPFLCRVKQDIFWKIRDTDLRISNNIM